MEETVGSWLKVVVIIKDIYFSFKLGAIFFHFRNHFKEIWKVYADNLHNIPGSSDARLEKLTNKMGKEEENVNESVAPAVKKEDKVTLRTTVL